jgi:adenylate cyclase
MTSADTPPPPSEDASPSADEIWRAMLLNPAPFRTRRRINSRIPSSPRCKMCAAPFAGPGGLVMRLMGHARWAKNPKYCVGCFRSLRDNHGGAEIDCSLLFADVRGSTPLAEQMRPKEFTRLMGRFYDTASAVLVDYDAYVDKFVGDEIIGLFVPALAGAGHAERAVNSARALLEATGHAASGGPWVPVGVGVNTGTAYVGSVGDGEDRELTAMGDVVNTTARLASAAAEGEILITLAAASSAGVLAAPLEQRSLALKGKSAPTDVFVMKVVQEGIPGS